MSAQLAAASSPALLPSIIAAVAAVISALLLAWVALRAQSAEKQRQQIREDLACEVRELLDAPTRALIIGEVVRRVMRQVLNEFGTIEGGRRWYDPDDG